MKKEPRILCGGRRKYQNVLKNAVPLDEYCPTEPGGAWVDYTANNFWAVDVDPKTNIAYGYYLF